LDKQDDSKRSREVARIMAELTGVPAHVNSAITTQKEERARTNRVKRFLALPPQLQEGILRYGENIRQAYKTEERG